MSIISCSYSNSAIFPYSRESQLTKRPDAKFFEITAESSGVVPITDERIKDIAELLDRQKKQEAEAQAKFQEKLLSNKAGVQTDGNIYWLNGKKNTQWAENEDSKSQEVTDLAGASDKNASLGADQSKNEFAATTKHGTEVRVQDVVNGIAVTGNIVKLLNIETQGGLQIQMELDQNVRVNDLDDGGVSLYFPDTGETKKIDADGNVTTETGDYSDSLKGTNEDDILININKSSVDAGEGNDIIFNLSENTVINAGEGDDTVFNFAENTIINGDSGDDRFFLQGQSQNLIINTGTGNNYIYGDQIGNSVINTQGSNDTIDASSIDSSNIVGTGNLNINLKTLNESNIQSAGDFTANIGGVRGTNIQVGKGSNQENSLYNDYVRLQSKANIVISSFSDSFLNTGGGDDTIVMNCMNNSFIDTGDGNDNIVITGANNSSIDTGDGNDSLTVSHSESSTIDMGNGDDKLVALGISESQVSMGNGNDTVAVNSAGGQSTLDTGDGNDKLYFGNMHGVKLGVDATQDKIFDSYSGFLYPYFEDPTQENWNNMVSIAHRYEKTQLFKNYHGQSISMVLGSGIQDGKVSYNV